MDGIENNKASVCGDRRDLKPQQPLKVKKLVISFYPLNIIFCWISR